MDRTYQVMSSGAGAVAIGTVATFDHQTALLSARDYGISICMAGPTSARPEAGDGDIPCPGGAGQVQGGILYLDTTLGYVIVSDGSGGWRNPANGDAV